ncbi:MAG: choice-of-anchor R domain-containing protein [Chloroflexota bacterium]
MSIRVYPGVKNPSHEISLSDGVRRWGLRLDGGPGAIQEIPMTPSTLNFTGGGSKFGDWEPGMSHIEQRTWEGGRGQEDFVEDPTRYYDAMNAWTITSGKVCPAPGWKFARGLRTSYAHLPGDIDWQPLIGDRRWLSVSFVVGADNFTIAQAYLWLRRAGSPGELSVSIYTDDDGAPGSLISGSGAGVSVEEIQDVVSQFYGFDLSACGNLSAGTCYHLVIAGAAGDSAANHWELGVDRSTLGGQASAEGTGWSEPSCPPYYRVVEARIRRRWHVFLYKEGLYAVDQSEDGQSSRLYLNGDRGVVTNAGSSSLTDSNKAWEADQWAGAWVLISEGTGVGQRLQISGNTNNTLLVDGWEITPDSSSEYVIFNTPGWQEISPTSGDCIDGMVTDTAVVEDEALLAQGMSTYILRMRWNPEAVPPAHEFADDGSNRADLLFPHIDSVNGEQLWRVKQNRSRVSRAAIPDWGTTYTYQSDIVVGSKSEPINNICAHNGKLYAFKTDGRYQINTDDSAEKTVGEIGFIPSSNNGEALLSQGLFVYFSWGGYALQRLYDSGYSVELSSIGPDQKGGLPAGRGGRIRALAGYPNGILAAVDAGRENISSVLVRPEGNYGWHEIFRAWEPGAQVNNLFWQQVGDARPRLWISVGGELVYQEWPLGGDNPLADPEFDYQHEAVLISSTIDMGAARLPKFFKEFNTLSANLSGGVKIELDYQVDGQVGSDAWIWAGSYAGTREETLPIGEGNARKIRLRLRLQTNDRRVPPVVEATVLEGFARTPLKYQWNLQVKIGDCQPDLSGGGPDQDPDALLSWLKAAAGSARAVEMRSIWEQLDGKLVIIEPPSLLRSFTNNLLGYWGGSVSITLREC